MEEDTTPLYLAVFRNVAKDIETLPKERVMHITEVMKVLRDYHEKPVSQDHK